MGYQVCEPQVLCMAVRIWLVQRAWQCHSIKQVGRAGWVLSVRRPVCNWLDCSDPALASLLAFVLDPICHARVLRGESLQGFTLTDSPWTHHGE